MNFGSVFMGDQNYTFRVALANPGYTHRLYPTANRGHTLARVDASTKASYRKEIGRRLKRARQKAGIATQAQAAERLGEALSETIEPSRIGNYEQGIRTPDPLTMKVLCEIYGAYPSYIYGFDEDRRTKPSSCCSRSTG